MLNSNIDSHDVLSFIALSQSFYISILNKSASLLRVPDVMRHRKPATMSLCPCLVLTVVKGAWLAIKSMDANRQVCFAFAADSTPPAPALGRDL
jgi:hypothetical protein